MSNSRQSGSRIIPGVIDLVRWTILWDVKITSPICVIYVFYTDDAQVRMRYRNVDLYRLPLVRRACAGWGVPITAVSNVKETERKHTGALFHLDEPV